MRARLMAAVLVLMAVSALNAKPDPKTWSVKADYIEACSCHLFCPCYFNTGPEGGQRCEFDMAVKIADGHVGGVDVTGMKYWLSGDLGGDWVNGMKGVVVTVEPKSTKPQRDALVFLLGQIYPVKWHKVEMDTSEIAWEIKGKDANGKLANGKGEIALTGVTGADGKQTVLNNVPYFGAQRNNGFYLAKSKHFYKGFGFDYAHEDKNGFIIHLESEGTLDAPK